MRSYLKSYLNVRNDHWSETVVKLFTIGMVITGFVVVGSMFSFALTAWNSLIWISGVGLLAGAFAFTACGCGFMISTMLVDVCRA